MIIGIISVKKFSYPGFDEETLKDFLSRNETNCHIFILVSVIKTFKLKKISKHEIISYN